MFRRSALFTLSFLLSSLVASTAAIAQDVLTPKWTYFGASNGKVSYSNDGVQVLTQDSRGFTVYNANTHAITTHEEWEHFEDASFGFDGKNIFYSVKVGTNSQIFQYNLKTKARTPLSGISESAEIIEITTSNDGKKLAYSTLVNSTTWKIHIYSLETSGYLSQFNHTSVPEIRFTEGDSKVLLSGPTVLDLAGNVVRSATSVIEDRFDLSPDGTTIIAWDNAVRAFRYSDLASRWSYTPNRQIDSAKVTRDGGSVLFILRAEPPVIDSWQGRSLLMSSGSLRPGYVTSSPNDTPRMALSPTSDRLLLTWTSTPTIKEFKFSTSTGGASFSGPFADGRVNGWTTDLPSAIRFTVFNSQGTLKNSLSVGESIASKLTATLIDQSSGQLLGRSTISPDHPVMYSPLGTNLFFADEREKLLVRKWDGSGAYATLLVDPANAYGEEKGWANEQLIWVNKGADRGILQVRFDGASIVKERLIKGTFDIAAMTSDESRIAMRRTTGPVEVHEASHGALLGTIPALSSGPISKLQFVGANRLVIYEFNETTHENTLRLYDVTSAPVLLHIFTETETGDRYDNCGVVSPGGNFYAFGHTEFAGSDRHTEGAIRIFRVADGAVVRQWANQYLGAQLAMEFSLDEFLLTWVTGSGMLTAAVVPTIPATISVSPSSISGAGTVGGTVTLNRVANQDTSVHLTSTSANVTGPANVTVVAGSSLATFDVTVTDVVAPTSTTLKATLGGATVMTTLTVNPSVWVTSIEPSATDLSGNTTVDVTVHLNNPAPAGFAVSGSSSAAAITVPSSISIPEGATSTVVTLTVKKVTADKTATITIGGQTAQIHLHAPSASVTSVTSDKLDVTGNDTIHLTINLDAPAPASFTVPGSSNSAAISVPSTISIPEGQTSFILTLAVRKVTADRVAKITIGGKSVSINLHAP